MIEKKKTFIENKKVLTQSFPRNKQTNIQFEFDMIMILSSKNHQLYSQRFCDKSILTCTYMKIIWFLGIGEWGEGKKHLKKQQKQNQNHVYHFWKMWFEENFQKFSKIFNFLLSTVLNQTGSIIYLCTIFQPPSIIFIYFF